jgi:hypothetical protein
VGACSPDGDSATVEIFHEDGVEVRLHRGPDVELEWTFDEAFSIRPEVEGEVRFADLSPWEVGADRDGRIYVLDRTGGRVLVFGQAGRMVGTLGRPGAGPGEFSDPVALAVSAEGDVAAYDYATGGVVRWAAGGGPPDFVRPAPLFWGPELGLASWGVIFPSVAADGRDGRTVHLVVIAETRTGVLAELEQVTVAASFPACGIGGIPVEPFFEPQLEWSMSGDLVAAVAGPAYSIEVSMEGVPERRIEREVAERIATRELALAEAEEGLELTAPVRCQIPARELVDARGFASVIPAITNLAVAPDRSIWAERGRVRGEERQVDVFDPEGAYAGTLPPGSPFPVAFAGGASDYRIVSLRQTATDETEIVAHRIAR